MLTFSFDGTIKLWRLTRATGAVILGGHKHVLLDAHLGRIPDPAALARALSEVPGVVEHGLFLGLASRAVLAGAEGIVVLDRQS